MCYMHVLRACFTWSLKPGCGESMSARTHLRTSHKFRSYLRTGAHTSSPVQLWPPHCLPVADLTRAGHPHDY